MEDGDTSQLLARIQAFIAPRRIRVRDFLVDFDPKRLGTCSAPQFKRALDRAGLTFAPGEFEELLARYRIPGAAQSVEVQYAAFCAEVDQVFADSRIPGGSPKGSLGPARQDRLGAMIEKLAMLCKTRGVVFKSCYGDFERAPCISPARVTPRQAGKVTKSQFIRGFPFNDRFKPEEIQFIAEAFATEQGDVHYQALHDSLSEINGNKEQPFARSDLVLKQDTTEWSHSRLNPMDKLRSKVVEKRVRLYEHFQDFDALRKGTCTVGQVKSVFTILDLTKVISRDDFEYITNSFCRDDGMFCYRDFCREADKDFTTPGLEKEPLYTIAMPDAITTSPGRRNRMEVRSELKRTAIEALHDRIASKVRKNRILLMPAFKDMDKNRQCHVTVSQFARVLVPLNLGLSDAEVDLLRSVYCDLGNHLDFNYVDFVQRVDPPSDVVLADSAKRSSPRPADAPTKYFSSVGGVRPLDRSFHNHMVMA